MIRILRIVCVSLICSVGLILLAISFSMMWEYMSEQTEYNNIMAILHVAICIGAGVYMALDIVDDNNKKK